MIQTWLDSKDAVFFVGFVLGALCLALLTSLFRGLKQEGVRALKESSTTAAGLSDDDLETITMVEFSRCETEYNHRISSDWEVVLARHVGMALRGYYEGPYRRRLLQSANAGKPLDPMGSRVERQRLKQQ